MNKKIEKKQNHKFVVMPTIVAALALLAGFFLTGCLSGTSNTIREYNEAGAMIRETVTSESVVKTVTLSTEGKIVYINDQSWLAGVIFVPPGSDAENVTGAAKILTGKNDRQYIAVPVGSGADMKFMPEVIKAARAGEIGVGTSGITSQTTNSAVEIPDTK